MLISRTVRAGALALLFCSLPALAHAETLREALTSAYVNNPTLLSALLNVKITAEGVVAVETDAALAAHARSALAEAGAKNASVVEGALETAGQAGGPYDVIVLEGVIAAAPQTLFAQLKPEGRLVALLARDGNPPVAHLFAKAGNGIAARAAFDARLPPLSAERDESFVF